jgi:hypothetical protein
MDTNSSQLALCQVFKGVWVTLKVMGIMPIAIAILTDEQTAIQNN